MPTVAVRGVGLGVIADELKLPSESVLALRAKENAGGIVAVTTIWSLVMLAVAYCALSIVVGVLSVVVTVPRLLLLVDEVTVTALAVVQLKQYNVPTVKSPLGKVTSWPVTFVAVAMLGQAVPPVGHDRLVVLTVNAVDAPSVYPVGKLTTTCASAAVTLGLAHTVPVVAVLTCMRSKRTKT